MKKQWDQTRAETIIQGLMLGNDAFSQLLGMKLTLLEEKRLHLTMTLTEQMTNGFKIAHGGIVYSLCDSAMAFLSNSHGIQGVTIDSQIAHIKPSKIGDILTAQCTCVHRGNTLGRYQIHVYNQLDSLIATFVGTVIFGEEWEVDN